MSPSSPALPTEFEPIITKLHHNLSQYQQNSHADTLTKFIALRRQLAKMLLTLSNTQLESAYTQHLRILYPKFLESYILYEALTEPEKSFVKKIATAIKKGAKEPKFLQYLLTAMLYQRAHQWPIPYESISIPRWLVPGYMSFMFAAPRLFQELGEADNHYRHMQKWINYLYTTVFSQADLKIRQAIADLVVQYIYFTPLYFNQENLKTILSQSADILEFLLKSHGFPLDYTFPPRTANSKIRLGILSRHLEPLPETFATLPVFEHLDREQFEIILYVFNLKGNPFEQYCLSRADKWVTLTEEVLPQVEKIRQDNLDILWLGTNMVNVYNSSPALLISHRLARIQMTGFCSPVTTGISNIDYYVSGKLTEPAENPQQYYREQLILLEDTGFCYNYPVEPYTGDLNRNSLGIAEQALIFISTANFFKIIPELRVTWAKIMAAVPHAVLILTPFGSAWSSNYPKNPFIDNMRTLFAEYGIASHRLLILEQIPPVELREILKFSDIYLDSYPYAGATSIIDVLAVNLPLVLRENHTLRSRQGAALMRALGIPEAITDTEEAYIKLAITLANSPQLRQQQRDKIAHAMKNNPTFIDSQRYAKQMGTLFQQFIHSI
jgi:predicted O-linked N-acetylglucosamine transferase (SPINDLY family)